MYLMDITCSIMSQVKRFSFVQQARSTRPLENHLAFLTHFARIYVRTRTWGFARVRVAQSETHLSWISQSRCPCGESSDGLCTAAFLVHDVIRGRTLAYSGSLYSTLKGCRTTRSRPVWWMSRMRRRAPPAHTHARTGKLQMAGGPRRKFVTPRRSNRVRHT
jgi:hypothetical protein